jgi:hypothetical protein
MMAFPSTSTRKLKRVPASLPSEISSSPPGPSTIPVIRLPSTLKLKVSVTSSLPSGGTNLPCHWPSMPDADAHRSPAAIKTVTARNLIFIGQYKPLFWNTEITD